MPELKQPFSLKQFFGRIGLLAVDADGTDIEVLAETDGTLRVSNFGHDASGDLVSFKLEDTGEQDIVLHGKDSGGTIDPLRTNSNQQLQVEVVENAKQVDAVELTTAAAAVYNPGSTASEIYAVWFQCRNITTTGRTVDVGVDLGGGTTFDRTYMNDYPVPALEGTGWHFLGHIAGDDDVVALASANSAIIIWLAVRQLV